MLASDIRSVAQLSLLPEDSFYVTVKGKVVDWKTLKEGSLFDVHFRLRGGKGGFGSLLRSFRIHRSTNQLMCRDLSGRRLADIKEEEKLRKWIEKAAEREEEKRRQREEKYKKLKAGPPKHDFNDQTFIKTREKILDGTDEAFEAGIAAAKTKKNVRNEPPKVDEGLGGDEEDDGDDLGEGTGLKRKRKPSTKPDECKKPKVDEELKPAFLTVSPVIDKSGTENEKKERSQKMTTPVKSEKPKPTEEKESIKPTEFKEVNLDDYDNAESLQSLGLDHLKHALEVRGLKCGGSLLERAARLYSVKGLKPEQYPKNIRGGGKRK